MCEEDSQGLPLALWEETNEELLFHQTGKTLAICLGAVEEILLTGWNEGKACKRLYSSKRMCVQFLHQPAADVHSLDIRNSNASLSKCHAGF